jgi:hypothetical protein
MKSMMRFVRIGTAMAFCCAGATAIHNALGLGQEFVGPGLGGLVDLALLAVTGLLVSLSDREYFWATPPKQGRRRHRARAAR